MICRRCLPSFIAAAIVFIVVLYRRRRWCSYTQHKFINSMSNNISVISLQFLLPFDDYLIYTTSSTELSIIYVYLPPNFHNYTTPPLLRLTIATENIH